MTLRELAKLDMHFDIEPLMMLKSTGFGPRRTKGREANLHSHLGGDFALDWAILTSKENPALECEIFCSYRLLCLTLHFVL